MSVPCKMTDKFWLKNVTHAEVRQLIEVANQLFLESDFLEQRCITKKALAFF